MNKPTIFEPEKVTKIDFTPQSGHCNTPDEKILEQVNENIRRGLPQVFPHAPNPYVALLVCGGPSLNETEKELRDAYWKGGKVVTTNASYQWCIDRNIKPSAQVMLDAREFNSRFIETPVEGCKYLLAAQCHPTTFEKCRDRETIIWHACSAGLEELALINKFYFDRCHPITLGTSVGIRAISLLRLLGFTSIEIFGLDSCWMGNKHHSYDQPENNRDLRGSVWLRPKDRDDKVRQFFCAPWHMKQADDFLALIRTRGDLFQLNVHGDGLLATIIKTGAEIQMELDAQEDAK